MNINPAVNPHTTSNIFLFLLTTFLIISNLLEYLNVFAILNILNMLNILKICELLNISLKQKQAR